MKPIIGINCDFQESEPSRSILRCDYFKAVEKAGGIPVLLAPLEEGKDITDLLKRLDGLILSGGDDIWPERYGQIRNEKTVPVPKVKDRFDFQLVKQALDMDMPVLGICYGAQLINVVLGGSLIQDIPALSKSGGSGVSHKPKMVQMPRTPQVDTAHTPCPPKADAAHKIKVERRTRLYEFLKAEVLMVNSSHHQAIDRLGEGLKVSAQSEDGIVEAVESVRHSLVIGVQWHPERMLEDATQLGLFTAFLEEMKHYAPKRL